MDTEPSVALPLPYTVVNVTIVTNVPVVGDDPMKWNILVAHEHHRDSDTRDGFCEAGLFVVVIGNCDNNPGR